MINIIVRSKVYTEEELKGEFKRYSDDDGDFDEFIAAMIKTKQITRRADGFHPTTTTATSKTTEVDQYRVYNTQKHGGIAKSTKGNYQRIAIAGKTWSKKADPTNMYVSSYYSKKTGRFEPIKERIPLVSPDKPPVKPRQGERWRANIPADIVREYKLKAGQPIKVRVLTVTETYYGLLSLWGYKLGGMIAFGMTSKHQEDRKIELRAENFNMETYGKIKDEINSAGPKLLKTTEKWLELYDKQYYEFFNNCGKLVTKEAPPHKGEYIEPVKTYPGKQSSIIEFEDLDGRKPTVQYDGILPRNWVEKDESTLAASFYLRGQDYVVHGYKGRDRKFKAKKGEKKAKQFKPYSDKQSTLSFPNKPGYMEKK